MLEHNFFWLTFAGDVDLTSLGLAYRAFRNHPHYVDGIDELLDFSSASFKNLSTEDIKGIWEFMRNRPNLHHNKSVIVVSGALEYGLSRMMGSMMDRDVPVERWITYSLEEALEWLRPGETQKLHKLHQCSHREEFNQT